MLRLRLFNFFFSEAPSTVTSGCIRRMLRLRLFNLLAA
jgi:hypothetical protein